MPIRTLVGLLLCNLIWALNPAAGKVLLRTFDPLSVAWLRYASCFVAYFAATRVLRLLPHREPWSRVRFDHTLMTWGKGRNRLQDFRTLLLGGVLTFCISPILQATGLASSRATDNALITAIEPLITLLLARLFLHEKLPASLLVSFGTALTGFTMLSGVNLFASVRDVGAVTHLTGNLLILASLVGEGSYSIYGRKLMTRHPANEIFGSAVGVGVLALTMTIASIRGLGALAQCFDLASWSWSSLFALLWLGPIGTAFTYLYWIFALGNLSVGSLVLTLFVQPLVGAAFGSLFLGEYLTLAQWLGGGLILASVLGQVWVQGRNRV